MDTDQEPHRLPYRLGSLCRRATGFPRCARSAVDLDISYNTVNRAYMDLEREGYISTRKGRGTFVAERHDLGAHTASDSPIELSDRRHDPRMFECGLGRRRHRGHGGGAPRPPGVHALGSRLRFRCGEGAERCINAQQVSCLGMRLGDQVTVFIVARYCDNVTL